LNRQSAIGVTGLNVVRYGEIVQVDNVACTAACNVRADTVIKSVVASPTRTATGVVRNAGIADRQIQPGIASARINIQTTAHGIEAQGVLGCCVSDLVVVKGRTVNDVGSDTIDADSATDVRAGIVINV
jgi:hypothetical protein